MQQYEGIELPTFWIRAAILPANPSYETTTRR